MIADIRHAGDGTHRPGIGGAADRDVMKMSEDDDPPWLRVDADDEATEADDDAAADEDQGDDDDPDPA